MKTKYLSVILVVLLGAIGCTQDIENVGYQPEESNVDYAALRAYKASDHEYMFGWFGGWNDGAASMSGSLRSLPDSMDLVSIWGEWMHLTDAQKADLKYVQEVKGTKVVACLFVPTIGKFITPEGEDPKAYWGWDDEDEDKQEAAIRKYSRELIDVVIGLGYDGIDMDNEKESENVYGNVRLTTAFVDEVGKKMGPTSGTGRIFCIDGSFATGMIPENDKHVNFYIHQAYGATSNDERLDLTLSSIISFYKGSRKEMARKYIPTCDFELRATVGGGHFVDREGREMTIAEGYALHKPKASDGTPLMKGGSGMYHIENDYMNSFFDYYYTRKAIQLMNPKGK